MTEIRTLGPDRIEPARDVDVSAPPGWFAVFTQPRHEKKVVGHLELRDIEAFLPTYRSRHVWKNRQTVTLDLPLFPSYLFVKLRQRQRGAVLGVPGVLGIVGNSHSVSTISEKYVAALRDGIAQNRILPHAQPAVGDRVRIVSGSFAGFEGVLANIRSEFRVVLTIESIQRSVSVEVSRNDVEPVLAKEVRAIADFAHTQAL